MSASADHEQSYRDAQQALQRALSLLSDCTPAEKEILLGEFQQLQDMAVKLRNGQVEIIVFGEINTGKSALINALVGSPVAKSTVVGGETRSTNHWHWDDAGYRLPGFAESEVHLVDTPGINEVDGAERARIASEAAQRADLILFVTDSDVNDQEFTACRELARTNRPILVAFNKSDLYSTQDRRRLVHVLQERFMGIVDSEDIVEISADPLEREYVIEQPDGTEQFEMRKPKARVDNLKERILAVLERDGTALVALNGALFAADRTDRIASLRVELRDRHATSAIWSYASAKGLTIALNPIPVADILGGAAIDILMIIHLGRIYGFDLTHAKASGLVKSIGAAAGGMMAIEGLTHLAASVFKGMSLGTSIVVTALPQGAVGGFGSYIVGKSAKAYFEQGASWGPEGANLQTPLVSQLLRRQRVRKPIK